MTLTELVAVVPTTTEITIQARNSDGHYLHEWIIGDRREPTGNGLLWDIASGKITVVRISINHHHRPDRRGYPEMGWAVDLSAIPPELAQAEITHLDMKCTNGVEYRVRVEVRLPEIQFGMVKGWGCEDETL